MHNWPFNITAAVIIWGLQDRMCRQSNKHDSDDGRDRRSLYKEVLRADAELKQLVEEMPQFFKSDKHENSGIPEYIFQQGSILLLSIAHKVSSNAMRT